MGLRELVYRATGNRPTQAALRGLAGALRVPGLRAGRAGAPRHPFLVAVTIDTEGGFVDRDEARRWQGANPDAFQGYREGVRNVRGMLADHRTPATFLVSTHGLSAPEPARRDIVDELVAARDAGHEIGLHLHPTSDHALRDRLERLATSDDAPVFDDGAKLAMVRASTDLLCDAIGTRAASFRWGNWGLDASGVRALADAGFAVDSSAIPGCRDTRRPRAPRFRWEDARSHAPWWLDRRDAQSTSGDSDVLELPIATCRWLGRWWRADPLYLPLLDAMLAHYYEHAPRDRAPFPFVLMTHSSEATTALGAPTRALRDLGAFLARARRYADVELVTLVAARDLYLRALRASR